MTETVCPDLSGDAAVLFVEGGYTKFMDLTTRLTDLALQQNYNTQALRVAPTAFNVSFDFDGQLTPFVRPPRPALDASRFDFHAPPAPGEAPQYVPREVTTTPAPAFTTPDPSLSYGPRPDLPTVLAPTPPPRPRALQVPEPDAYTMPALPAFIDLAPLSAPALTIPQFDGQRPTFIEPPLNEDWQWSPTPYTSTLLDATKAKVAAMMAGGTGLGPIEDVLFARGRARIAIEVRRRIDERTDEFATRGFSEPNGILVASIDDALEDGLDQTASLNRDLTIKSYEEELTNLRFAVQQGIALEQVLVNLHLEEQKLLLAAAQFVRETSIAVLNARITVYNARVQAYATDAQVLAARIQGELAKLEVFRAELEAEKLKGDINTQRVQLYAEQIKALNAMAAFYTSRVEAVKAQADIEKSIIESFKAEVDAYSARWKAYGDQVDAYKAEVEAENGKATVHRTLVDAFATKTTAWSAQQNSVFEAERLRMGQHGQNLQAWRAGLDKMLGLIQGETARIGGEGQRADALARIYAADAAIEEAASAASDRSFNLGLERAKAQTEVGLKSAEIRVQENVQLTQILMQVQKTINDVLTQLAASSMSALNFNAGVSSSKSRSIGCDTSFSWSGEIADYGTI